MAGSNGFYIGQGGYSRNVGTAGGGRIGFLECGRPRVVSDHIPLEGGGMLTRKMRWTLLQAARHEQGRKNTLSGQHT